MACPAAPPLRLRVHDSLSLPLPPSWISDMGIPGYSRLHPSNPPNERGAWPRPATAPARRTGAINMQSNGRRADRAAGCGDACSPMMRQRSRRSLPRPPGAGGLGRAAGWLGVTMKHVDGRQMCDFRVQRQVLASVQCFTPSWVERGDGIRAAVELVLPDIHEPWVDPTLGRYCGMVEGRVPAG